MSNFDDAVKTVLAHEGGYVVDHAGPTNYGVTLATLRRQGDWDGDGYLDGDMDRDRDVDAHDVMMMTPDVAREVYRHQWWDRYGYGRIWSTEVATKLLDLSVNTGPRRAHIIIQRALRACGVPVVPDGILGPKTRAAIGEAHPAVLVVAMRAEAAVFYRGLVSKRPEFERYIEGWLRRAYS